MTDIEQAREIFTRWGKDAHDGEWSIDGDAEESTHLARAMTDPAFREVLDRLLAKVQDNPYGCGYRMVNFARGIAATIIAIDQRLSA